MLSSSFLFFLATTASAAVLESLNAVPAGWKYTGAASNDEPIRLQIALQQGDAAGFEQAVIDMSTPGKIYPNYTPLLACFVKDGIQKALMLGNVVNSKNSNVAQIILRMASTSKITKR